MNKMQFDYEVYFRQNCLIPSLLILFCVFVIILSLKSITFHHVNIKEFLLKNVKIICFFILVAFLISINVVPLARGGIYLFSEKESDTVEINGVIEDTFELSWFGGSKYEVEQNNGNGEGIIIDGTKYYLVTYGELKQGDNVSIILLPKSQLILEIRSV